MLRVKAVNELPVLAGAGALGASAGAGGVSRDVMGEPIDLDSPGKCLGGSSIARSRGSDHGDIGPRPTALAVRMSLQRKPSILNVQKSGYDRPGGEVGEL